MNRTQLLELESSLDSSDYSVAELKNLMVSLDKLSRQIEADIVQFDSLRETAEEWKSKLEIALPKHQKVFLLPPANQLSLDDAIASLNQFVGTCTRVHSNFEALNELAGRLDSRADYGFEVVGVDEPSIATVAEQIDLELIKLQDLVRELSNRRDQARDLLELINSDLNPVGLVSAADSQELNSLAQSCFDFGLLKSDPQYDSLSRIRGDYEFVGILSCATWLTDKKASCDVIKKALDTISGDKNKTLDLLSWCNIEQLVFLSEDYSLSIFIRQIAFAACFKYSSVQSKELLSRICYLPHPNSVPLQFYQEYCQNPSNNELISSWNSNIDPKVERAKIRDRIIANIDRPNKGGSTYLELRELARRNFFQPLKDDIANSNFMKAELGWKSQGNLEEKLKKITAALKHRQRPQNRHVDSLRDYITSFDQQLASWLNYTTPKGTFSKSALGALRKLMAEGDEEANRIVEIFNASVDDPGVVWPNSDFANRISSDGEVTSPEIDAFVSGLWYQSWVAHSENDPVSVWHLLADKITSKSRKENLLEFNVKRMLAEQRYLAAHLASVDEPALANMVEEALQLARNNVESNEYFLEVSAQRKSNEEIDAYCEEIEGLMAAFKFDEALEIVELLKAEYSENAWLDNPDVSRLVDLLKQAAADYEIGEPIDDLQKRWDSVCCENSDRRIFVECIRDAGHALSRDCRKVWVRVANFFDQPKHWPPTEETSCEWGDLFLFLGDYLEKQSRRNGQVALLATEWLEYLLLRKDEVVSSSTFEPLRTLQKGVKEDYWEIDEVCEFVAPASAKIKMPTVGKRNVADEPLPTPTSRKTDAVLSRQHIRPVRKKPLVASIRNSLLALDNNQEDATALKGSQIQQLVRDRKFEIILKHLPSQFESMSFADDELDSDESIVAIANALIQIDSDDVSSKTISVGILSAVNLVVTKEDFFGSVREIEGWINELVIAYARQHAGIELDDSDVLELFYEQVAGARRNDSSRKWFAALFKDASQFCKGNSFGHLVLANSLWHGFTSKKDPAGKRSKLLHSLYAIEFPNAISELCFVHCKTLRPYVDQFLLAQMNSSANPDAETEARRLKEIIHQNSSATQRSKAWVIFTNEFLKVDIETSSQFPCKVELEHVGPNSIAISFEPIGTDLPERISLSLGAEEDVFLNELIFGEVLTSRETMTFEVAQSQVGEQGFIRIPYKLDLRTISGNELSKKGVLSSDVSTFLYLSPRQLAGFWPGQGGDPVEPRYHYGRNDEIEIVESKLRGDGGKQGSVLVIGQRRIGKTSLLRQIMDTFPPAKGAVCAAYINVGSIQFPKEGSLPEVVFSGIITQLKDSAGDLNRRIIDSIEHKVLQRKIKSLKPRESLSAALEGLVDILSNVSGGLIQRLALCFDEFHDVFRWHDREDIERMMWDLRSTVTQSKKVSLLLAGSGLTRDLVKRYQTALFGTIKDIEIKPFSWQTENQAVTKTFLPKDMCELISRKSGNEYDPLPASKVAHQLCDGHPWFLSMLGLSVASLFGVTPITEQMVNHAADRMIKGEIKGGTDIVPEKFYGHLIDSLGLISNVEKSVAELLLVEIARRTTYGWPWVTSASITQNSSVAEHAKSKRQLVLALEALEEDDVLIRREKHSGAEYRIRIPLVAAAIRQKADILWNKAVNELES